VGEPLGVVVSALGNVEGTTVGVAEDLDNFLHNFLTLPDSIVLALPDLVFVAASGVLLVLLFFPPLRLRPLDATFKSNSWFRREDPVGCWYPPCLIAAEGPMEPSWPEMERGERRRRRKE
jgi:hypothetical protein